jgi:homoserine O-acetyltransferase
LIHPPLAAWHLDAPHREAALGDLLLESGEVLRDCRQSYVTHGTLSPAKDNVILVCASITGTHHRLDFLIGPGKALDTRRFFIVATDALGNGLSTSPSNSPHQRGMRFPRFVLRDMVEAQRRMLVEHLGIERLHAVAGASMGGMQALQWAVSQPAMVERVVALTPMARTAPWAALVTEALRSALLADPAWTGDGFSRRPDRGWRAYAGMMHAFVMSSPQAIAAAYADADAALAGYEDLVAAQRASGFDAHDYLYQSWAYAAHDVGTTPGVEGGTRSALARSRARTLIAAPPLDLFNPPEAAREAADAIPGARFVEIPSIQGHLAAGPLSAEDAAFLNRTIGEFLGDNCHPGEGRGPIAFSPKESP